jgi:hypothetical protein
MVNFSGKPAPGATEMGGMAHALSRSYRGLLTAAALCSPVAGAAFTACSSPFDTCEAHRSCPAGSGGAGDSEPGSGGTLGGAGANSDGGADAPNTITGSGGRSGAGPSYPILEGRADRPQTPEVAARVVVLSRRAASSSTALASAMANWLALAPRRS